MTRAALRRWSLVHKWTSLVCTLVLLVLCLTGAPLVFRDELNDLLDDALPYAAVPEGTPKVSLDRLVAVSRGLYPGETILSVFSDPHEPKIVVFMAQSWEQFRANRRAVHSIRFDAHTGQILKQTKPFSVEGRTFVDLLLQIHKDLFAGLTGELFLAAMALLFLIAIVSGVVVYGPFMRKLDFGTVRGNRSRRLKWLDLHNMIGVVT